jgi:ubiquinone/menaquinone biosynthesis C-methylase UbiE
MIKRARQNAKSKTLRPPHVAFVQADLTKALPITSNSIDCVLSNCVINLLPLNGKANLLKEIHRVLKPGGRLFADDVCTHPIASEWTHSRTKNIHRLSPRRISRMVYAMT